MSSFFYWIVQFTVLTQTQCKQCKHTKSPRIGSSKVIVAVLLVTSVQTATKAVKTKIITHVSMPLKVSKCDPIHAESPDF